MADDIKEHPNTALRREVEAIKLRLRILEDQSDHNTRITLVLVEKYEALKDLVYRALKIFASGTDGKGKT